MKILMLVNWPVDRWDSDIPTVQPPDKVIAGQPYWFFRYWPQTNLQVEVAGLGKTVGSRFRGARLLKLLFHQGAQAFRSMSQYDLIISHGAQSGLVLDCLRSLTGQRLPPHFIIDVGCFNGARENKLELGLVKYAGRSITGLIYHASIQQKYYQKHLPWLPAEFIPFGVDTDFFRPAPEPAAAADFILAFGDIKRDYATLLKAWSKLAWPQLKLKIIGGQTLLKSGQLPTGVEVQGRIGIEDLKDSLARARLVVLPLPVFDYAYGQMSLLQAMATAKPVIVTKTPATVDYVVDGQNAVFCQPGDADDLKEKLAHLLSWPEQATALGQRARADVLASFKESQMADRMYRFILRTYA